MMVKVRSWLNLWIQIILLKSVQGQMPSFPPTMDNMPPMNTPPANMSNMPPVNTPLTDMNNMPPMNTAPANMQSATPINTPPDNMDGVPPVNTPPENMGGMPPMNTPPNNNIGMTVVNIPAANMGSTTPIRTSTENIGGMPPMNTPPEDMGGMPPIDTPSTNMDSMAPSNTPSASMESAISMITPSVNMMSMAPLSTLSENMGSVPQMNTPSVDMGGMPPMNTPPTNMDGMNPFSSPPPNMNSMEPFGSQPPNFNSEEPYGSQPPIMNSMELRGSPLADFNSSGPFGSSPQNLHSMEPFGSPPQDVNSMEPFGPPPPDFNGEGSFGSPQPNFNSVEPISSPPPNFKSMEPIGSPPTDFNSMEPFGSPPPNINSEETFGSPPPFVNSMEPLGSPPPDFNSMVPLDLPPLDFNSEEPFGSLPPNSNSMEPQGSPPPNLNSMEPLRSPPPDFFSMEPLGFPPSGFSMEPLGSPPPDFKSMQPLRSLPPNFNSMEPLRSPPPDFNSMEPRSPPPDVNSMGPLRSPPPDFNSMQPLRSPPPNVDSMDPLRSPPPDFNSMQPLRSLPPNFNSMEPLRSSPPDFNSMEPRSPPPDVNSMGPLRSPPPDFNSMQPLRSPPPNFNSMDPLRSPPPDFNSMQPLRSLPPNFNSMELLRSSPPDFNSMEPRSPPPDFNSMGPLRSPPPDFKSMQPLRSLPPNFNSMEPLRSPPPEFNSMGPLRSPPPDFNSMQPLRSLPSNFNSMEPLRSPPPDVNSMGPLRSPPPDFNSMQPLRSLPPNFNSMEPLRSPPPDVNTMQPRSPSPDVNSMEPLRSLPPDLNSMQPLRSPPPDFNGMEPLRSPPPNVNTTEPLSSQRPDFNSMGPFQSQRPNFNSIEPLPSVTLRFQEDIKTFPANMVLSIIQGGRENTAVTLNLLHTDLNVLFQQSRCRDSFRSIENVSATSNGPSFLVRFDFQIQLGDRCTTFDYISSFNSSLTGLNRDTFGNQNVVVKDSFSFDLINERVNLTFSTENGLDTQVYLDPFSPEALTLERNILIAFKELSSSMPTFSHATFIPPFISGSLIGVFSLSFLQSTSISTNDLRSTLENLRRQDNFNFPGFTLQAISVEEVCPATLICLNGGVCVPDSSFRSMCSCAPDWQGDRCQRPVITLENVATASGMYATMTQQMNPMNVTVDDVETAAEVVQDIASLGVTDMQTTQNVVQIVNNVMNANESVIMETTSTQGQITRSLEQQLTNVDISQDETFSVSLPNVAVEALDVAPQNVRTFGVASFTSDTESQSSSFSDQVNVVDDTLTDEELVVFSSLEEVRDVHMASTYLQFPDNFADNILDQESLRAVFLVYRRPTLFNSQWLQSVNQNATQYTKSANTRVLSATLTNNGRDITFVPGFIEQRFMPLETDGKIFNPVCVFWDYEADGGNGNWSSDGCYYKGMTRDGQILCGCDHLTNFAVLMDIYGQGSIDPAQEKALEILSYVGCAVSIFGLITTIAVYVSQKKLRKLQPSKILVGLCVALLGLYLSFIATAISNTVGLGKIPCSIVAAVFHFFTLNALAWMGVEGANMYLLFVKVFDTYISNFMYKAIAFTTCVPLVAVAATVAVTREGYTRKNYCFLDRWPLIFGVIIPVGFIVTVNFIIFVLVIRQLLKSKAMKKSEKVKKRQNLKRARNALSIMSLTGLTWSLGFLSLVYVLSGPIQWLFTIVNSTQGFMIFMLYCVRHPTVVAYWKRKFPCCEVEAPGYTPSNTHLNSQTNPNSKSNGFTPSSVPVTSVEENRQIFGYR